MGTAAIPTPSPLLAYSQAEAGLSPHDLLQIVAQDPAAPLVGAWVGCFRYWMGDGSDALARRTANALVVLQELGNAALRARNNARVALTAPLVVAERQSLEDLLSQLKDQASEVRQMLDCVLEMGLRRRLGQRIESVLGLIPLAPDDPLRGAFTGTAPRATRDEIHSYLMVRELRRAVAPVPGDHLGLLGTGGDEKLSGVRVCEGCSYVFEPRRSDAMVCDGCRALKRTPFRASFMLGPERLNPGESAPLRASEIDSAGHLVRWRPVRVTHCVECRCFFTAHTHAVYCGETCGQKHRRREAA